VPDLLAKSLDFPVFVREKPCAVCGEPSDAHHMVAVGMGNSREKPSYRHLSCVNICRLHHGEYHLKGRVWFEEKYDINLGLHALALMIEWQTGVEAPFHNDKQRRT